MNKLEKFNKHLIQVPKDLLQSILQSIMSREQITFLSDVPSNMAVDKTAGWRHHYFDENIHELSTFIKSIGDDNIYLLIPLFAGSKSLKCATLNLSEPFLVDNKSNPKLIIKFILVQWVTSGFEIKPGIKITFF